MWSNRNTVDMNSLVFVLVLCFVQAFASPVDISAQDACLKGYGIEPTAIYNHTDKINSTQVYCVIACSYRTAKIMKSDGTIDLDKAEEIFAKHQDAEEKNMFLSVHNACKKGKTHCELVECMFGEWKNHIVKPSSSHSDEFLVEDGAVKSVITARLR